MHDFYIPNVSPNAMVLLNAYIKDKLPNHQVKVNEDNDVIIEDVKYYEEIALNKFIDVMKKFKRN